MLHTLCKVVNPANFKIGINSRVDDFVLISAESVELGRFVHIGSHVAMCGEGSIVVNDFATVSGSCRLYSSTDEFNGAGLTGPMVPSKYRSNRIIGDIIIGKHCIIGTNSVVLPGVVIGEGACVGAFSLVKTSLEPWTVYAGNPLRPIKKRERSVIESFEHEMIAEQIATDTGASVSTPTP